MTKAAAMPNRAKLTDVQMRLLRDLYALQQAGMIEGGNWLDVQEWNDGSSGLFLPPVVTDAGRAALAERDPLPETKGIAAA